MTLSESGAAPVVRDADLVALTDLRDQRRRLTAELASGRAPFFDTVITIAVPFLRDTRLVKILEQHPGLGKVAARRLLGDLGLDERVTLGGLSREFLLRVAEHLESIGREAAR